MLNKKHVLNFVCTISLLASLVVPVSASKLSINLEESDLCATSVQPRIDEIVTKYRVKDGVLQYRHWNMTKGVWVESDWITA